MFFFLLSFSIHLLRKRRKLYESFLQMQWLIYILHNVIGSATNENCKHNLSPGTMSPIFSHDDDDDDDEQTIDGNAHYNKIIGYPFQFVVIANKQ